MKTPYSSIIGCSIIIILASCGGNTTTESESSVQVPTLYLEGMYATSSKLPLSQYSLENVFDGKPDTYWSTALGAAGDEGVMLYFSERTHIKELRIATAAGNDLASIKKVSLYADGHNIASADPSTNISIDTDLTSLFIKIEETDHSEVVNPNGGDTSQERFDGNFSVGFSEIEFIEDSLKVKVVPPVAVAGSVVASSVLSPAEAYTPTQLFDARKEFVWAEGGAGSGENESLTFNLENDETISSIKIWNGYQRSEKHFTSNARIKSFQFGNSRYTLEDTMEPQVVKLTEPATGKQFVLKVLEVYPGKDYKDLVVSEILFFNNDRPFVIKNNEAEESVKSLMAKAKGSVLERYIDKRLKNHSDYGDYISDKSLILRSNRTFVLYEHTNSSTGTGEEEKETVADGNWEIIEQTENSAKVRIFGKLFNLTEAVELYKGNTSEEFIKIFQDNLHITPEQVKGEKYVEAFFNKTPDNP